MGIFSAHWGFRLLWGIGFLLKWEHQKPALHVVNHHKPSTNPLWCQILDDFGWFAGCQPTHSVVEAHWASKKGLSATTSRTLARPVFQDVSWLFCNDIEYIYICIIYIIYICIYSELIRSSQEHIFHFLNLPVRSSFLWSLIFWFQVLSELEKTSHICGFYPKKGCRARHCPGRQLCLEIGSEKTHTHTYIYNYIYNYIYIIIYI